MKKKIIGISSGLILGERNISKIYTNEDFVKSIILTGGIPVVIPVNSDESIIREQLELIDCLILSSGDDINPREYNENLLPKTGTPNSKRDYFDITIAKIAHEKKIPTLAICRGFQIVNVAFGGSLYQDVSYKNGSFINHDQWINYEILSHKVKIKKNSMLYEILNEKEIWVNSFHHQTLKEVADIFEITATSDDGLVESLELKNKDYFFLALQWHPDMMVNTGHEKMIPIFKKFMEI